MQKHIVKQASKAQMSSQRATSIKALLCHLEPTQINQSQQYNQKTYLNASKDIALFTGSLVGDTGLPSHPHQVVTPTI